MNALLVATDLSARSDRAVARAFHIAAETDAKLTVLSVIDEDLPETMAETLEAETKTRLAEYCAAQPHAKAVAHECRVIRGDPAPAIARAAEAAGVDLLVTGLHRMRPIRDLFFSTTLETLVRAALVPVLVVKDPADHDYVTGLGGVDLSPASAAALREASKLAPKAKLHAFHAYSVPFKGFLGEDGGEGQAHPFRDEAEASLREWTEAAQLPEGLGEIELIEASPSAALHAQLSKVKPDFLALGAHGRGPLNPTLLGEFTAELLREPPCDVLVVRR